MIVVVGVDVVPDDRLPLDDLGQRPALLGGDGLRDHHGPGPEHADGGVQLPPDGAQVLGLAHAGHGARRAVLHRAEQQRRPLQRRVQLVAHLAGAGEVLKFLASFHNIQTFGESLLQLL